MWALTLEKPVYIDVLRNLFHKDTEPNGSSCHMDGLVVDAAGQESLSKPVWHATEASILHICHTGPGYNTE